MDFASGLQEKVKLELNHIKDLVIKFVQVSWLTFCSCSCGIQDFDCFLYIYEVEQEFMIRVEVNGYN